MVFEAITESEEVSPMNLLANYGPSRHLHPTESSFLLHDVPAGSRVGKNEREKAAGFHPASSVQLQPRPALHTRSTRLCRQLRGAFGSPPVTTTTTSSTTATTYRASAELTDWPTG